MRCKACNSSDNVRPVYSKNCPHREPYCGECRDMIKEDLFETYPHGRKWMSFNNAEEYVTENLLDQEGDEDD